MEKIRLTMLHYSLLFVLGFGLTACESENISIELCGLNYTSRHIGGFSVNGYSGGTISPNSGGGGFVCCVSLPKRWRNGLQVSVRWKDDEHSLDAWKETIVEIPKYEESDIGFFAVHFYPDDSVKVLVTTKMSQHPGYPYPRRVTE